MAKKKTLIHTKIVVDVISEEPINEEIGLDQILFESEWSDYTVNYEIKKSKELYGRAAAKKLIEMNGDPEIYNMNSFGNIIDIGIE